MRLYYSNDFIFSYMILHEWHKGNFNPLYIRLALPPYFSIILQVLYTRCILLYYLAAEKTSIFSNISWLKDWTLLQHGHRVRQPAVDWTCDVTNPRVCTKTQKYWTNMKHVRFPTITPILTGRGLFCFLEKAPFVDKWMLQFTSAIFALSISLLPLFQSCPKSC